MGEVLYEASYQFNPFLLIPVVMFVFISVLPKISIKAYQGHGKMSKEEYASFAKTFCLVGKIFVILCICIMIPLVILSYKQTVGAYREGNYKTVEGYVENYGIKTVPLNSPKESFTIDGVEFSYCDLDYEGYNKVSSDGGVITHDGQYLKVGYVVRPHEDRNIIVYIEELPQ